MTQLTDQRLTTNFLFALLLLSSTVLQARRISNRRLVIHVPVKVKTHHHTHTVYKALHGQSGGGVKQTVYKLIGFSEGAGGDHDHGHGGHSHSQSYSHGMDHGEISYENKHDCESGKLMPSHKGGGGIFFNHYARHDRAEAEAMDYDEEQDEFIDVRDAWL